MILTLIPRLSYYPTKYITYPLTWCSLKNLMLPGSRFKSATAIRGLVQSLYSQIKSEQVLLEKKFCA